MNKNEIPSIGNVNTLDRVKYYWNKRPCNLKHSDKKVGSREYFNDVEKRKYFVEPHITKFAGFSEWQGKKVLEIGCGLGTDTINFARAGAIVTAVDLSVQSVNLARNRAKLFGFDNIKLIQGNVEELSKILPIQEYDLIYSFGVLHHTPRPEIALKELKKYMGTNSEMRIMLYNRISWKVFWILISYGKFKFWNLKEIVRFYSEAQTGCPVTYTYSNREIVNLLRQFTIDNISVAHIFPYKIEDYVNYRYNKVWYFKYMPKSLFSWLERHFGWHICIRCH